MHTFGIPKIGLTLHRALNYMSITSFTILVIKSVVAMSPSLFGTYVNHGKVV